MKRIKTIIASLKSEYIDIWSSESDAEIFEKSFKVFEDEINRLLQESASTLSNQRAKLARTSEYQNTANPYVLRFKLYEKFIEKLKGDILDSLNKIILSRASDISPESSQRIYQRVSLIFIGQMNEATYSESRVAISRGRQKDIKSVQLPVEGLFKTANSKFMDQIRSIVNQHNLDKCTQRIEEHRKRRLEVIKTISKWTPISAGVAYLLKLIISGLLNIK
jgi:hypothetical protein